MARKLRILNKESIYHVFARGNNKETIFHGKEDYQTYANQIQRWSRRIRTVFYSFVLMPNHMHFIVRSDDLSKFMHGLQTCYGIYYNQRHKHVGHVFQGRYKSLEVSDNLYLVALSKYIHGNPQRAGLAGRSGEYPWSSCRSIFDRATLFNFLDAFFVDEIFRSLYGGESGAYRKYVEEDGARLVQ